MLLTHLSAMDGLLLGALAHAVWTDVRWRRISNWMTYAVAAVGLVAHAVSGGAAGLATSASGLALAVALLVVPCRLGAMGMGDLKLLAAIGALEGPRFVLGALLYAALAGGALAAAILIRRAAQRGVRRVPRPGQVSMPYGPALAAGALCALAERTLGPLL